MIPIRCARLGAVMLLMITGVVMATGCGEDDTQKDRTVTGFWNVLLSVPGKDDADVSHWLLEQSGAQVTGQICSSEKTSCTTPINGSFVDPNLALAISHEEQDVTYTFTAILELGAKGKTMIGTGKSTKCNCTIPIEATLVER